MKNTLNTSEAASLLMADDNAAWSMAGAYALAEYLEQIEYLGGAEIEFDRVAIRCEYSEYESLQEWARCYFTDDQLTDGYFSKGDEGHEENIRDFIRDHGQLIEFDGGIIVSEF
tara:strand:- start:787 stop:1128 length:342 start_codon:yes stop_codon:yes gene_type:complete